MSARRAPAPRALVLLLCAAEVLSMTGFAAYPALLPLLQHHWQLSSSAAGLISGAFFAGYMVATPLLVGLTDRYDTRRIYLLACLLASAGSLGFALLARGLWTALLFQALVGAGLAGTYMPGLRLLTDHFQGSVPSRAVAFYTATFGLGTTASLLLAGALQPLGWPWVFGCAAFGPLLAGALVFVRLPPAAPVPSGAPPGLLFDFRPVLRNRAAMGYILGYAAHCWELFGLRSWLPAFFAFSLALHASSGGFWFGAAALAAWINLLGPAASILGNEAAVLYGRRRFICATMLVSSMLACLVGFTANWPMALLFPLTAFYFLWVMADSAALTAGLVAATEPGRKGATMALHALLGFGAGFVAPLAFGLVLDLGGGRDSVTAWGLAFASLGVWSLLAALAASRRRAP
ncbi:MFS transporter [Desulfuromonas thiophila]|uniref:MFS transporter n=1 Tax=Desulfuromonas thiophila TaxID=57664 RepID=UPI0029F4F2DD|nr:MFS transporter [Desulfuromonas thiophila]